MGRKLFYYSGHSKVASKHVPAKVNNETIRISLIFN